MSIIGKLREKWKRKRELKGVGRLEDAEIIGRSYPVEQGPPPPVISTTWGPVTESARLRAALNMREDPAKRQQVEQLLANQLFNGDLVAGIEESRRRYREAYE